MSDQAAVNAEELRKALAVVAEFLQHTRLEQQEFDAFRVVLGITHNWLALNDEATVEKVFGLVYYYFGSEDAPECRDFARKVIAAITEGEE